MFSIHKKTEYNTEPAFSNSAGFQSVLEKLPFRNGFVYTVSL